MKSLFILLGVVVIAAHSDYLDNAYKYRGDKVVEVTIKNDKDYDFIMSLNPDIWTYRSTLQKGRPNKLRLTSKAYEALLTHPSSVSGSLTHRVVIPDLEANLRANARVARQPRGINSNSNSNSNSTLRDEWYYEWHSYAEIQAKLAELAARYPAYVTPLPTIGVSYEGRNISGVRLGRGAQGAKRVAFTAGTHAREWASEAVVMWFLGMSVQEMAAGTSPLLTRDVDVYIVPCYNPDGYEYSRRADRYWRKNRRLNYDGSYGVDQNRNWGDHWAEVGVSFDPSDECYCGESAFSEAETRALSNWISQGAFSALIDFHSVAGMFLRPYGYKFDEAPDEQRLKALGGELVRDVQGVHGTVYENIRGVDLYPAAGATDDWSYEIAGIPSVFTIEVGGDDFAPPVTDIQIRGEELYPALKRFVLKA